MFKKERDDFYDRQNEKNKTVVGYGRIDERRSERVENADETYDGRGVLRRTGKAGFRVQDGHANYKRGGELCKDSVRVH